MTKKKSAASQSKQFKNMENLVIDPLTRAIRKAHKAGNVRAEAQEAENKLRAKVELLMIEHGDTIRKDNHGADFDPDTADDDNDLVYITGDNIETRIKHGKDKMSIKRVEKEEKEPVDDGQTNADGQTAFNETPE